MSRVTGGRTAPRGADAIHVVRLPLGEEDIRPTFRRERAALKRGVWPVAGCDEAGRGPLAGPVVAAAVIDALESLKLKFPVSDDQLKDLKRARVMLEAGHRGRGRKSRR